MIDVGFASLAVYSPALEVTRLFNDKLILVVGKRHPFAGLISVPAAELERERWILFERGASIRRATDNFFKDVGVVPEKSLESNDTYFIKLMIEHGLGISLMPAWAVRDELKSGKLARTEIDGHELTRSVAMVSLKGAQSAPIRAFTAFMLERNIPTPIRRRRIIPVIITCVIGRVLKFPRGSLFLINCPVSSSSGLP